MKNVLLAIVVAASTIVGAATSSSAQSVYFGIGDGPRYDRHHYRGDGYRHHYRGDGYRYGYRHRAYAGDRCRVRVVRRFNEYRGVWVTKRIRTCY